METKKHTKKHKDLALKCYHKGDKGRGNKGRVGMVGNKGQGRQKRKEVSVCTALHQEKASLIIQLNYR